ncbi:hypothetical protein BOTBODRAFT_135853 [Botryobasidium botryosum FD-172 SS1]|uniref:Uncharacterized protein n=1 Tax=Botryobasidium botryosum (strain FD-172 SS1) TaxID=930990 RepID=A0A067MII1_BOTB1|nr:hypothetical protein BOTBODRAFT_135853 [Botryobasidium botryosum FD-172 SS1]
MPLHPKHSKPSPPSSSSTMTLRPSFQPGRYRLRAVLTSDPDPSVGGLFATGGDPSQPITTAPNDPRFADRQTWDIVENKDENKDEHKGEKTYKIIYAGKEGFSYASTDKGAPITLGPPKDFTLRLWPGTDVYVIRPTEFPITDGFDICVGIMKDQSELDIHYSFPASARPAWKLYRV